MKSTPRTQKTRIRATAALAAMLIALVVAGCGSTYSKSSTSSAEKPATTSSASGESKQGTTSSAPSSSASGIPQNGGGDGDGDNSGGPSDGDGNV